MNICLLSSYGGVGKDYVADVATKLFSDHKLHKVSLGAPVHEEADRIAGQKVTDRKTLQEVAEGNRKKFGLLHYIELAEQTINQFNNQQHSAIIPDVRKFLEFSYFCVERGFKPIYVTASKETITQRLLERDGSFDESALNNNLETQMRFIEDLPKVHVEGRGLKKVVAANYLNNIYVINTDYDVEQQLLDWSYYV